MSPASFLPHSCLLNPSTSLHSHCHQVIWSILRLQPRSSSWNPLKCFEDSLLPSGSSPKTLTRPPWPPLSPCSRSPCILLSPLGPSFSPSSRLRSLPPSFLHPEIPPCHSRLVNFCSSLSWHLELLQITHQSLYYRFVSLLEWHLASPPRLEASSRAKCWLMAFTELPASGKSHPEPRAGTQSIFVEPVNETLL